MEHDPLPTEELAGRRERLSARMEEAGLDAVFLSPSADLEYLTGVERDVPSFGQIAYAHGWVTGAFFALAAEPRFVLPRMFVAFHLADREPGETVVVAEDDDGEALFSAAARGLGPVRRVGIGARTPGETVLGLQRALPGVELVDATPLVNGLRRVKSPLELELMAEACRIAEDAMAATSPRVRPGVTTVDLAEEVEHQLRLRGSRTPSFATHIFTFGHDDSRDSQLPSGLEPVREGEPVLFDFGGVWRGYCSDFGRTVVAGEPPAGYHGAYETMLAAQEAGRLAAVPGARACDVNAACRGPIEDAGLGEHFRHRMGHSIGLDVHERPFLSVEDETPLEPGMTFTDEPSLVLPGRFGVRIEDVIAVAGPDGAQLLTTLSSAAVVN